MPDAKAIAETITTYEKHGWILRRVLLTKESNRKLQDKSELFSDVAVVDSSIDAAWFSRPPKSGGVAWEIRYLGDIPYALLEMVDENDPKFENILSGIELRLRQAISSKTSA